VEEMGDEGQFSASSRDAFPILDQMEVIQLRLITQELSIRLDNQALLLVPINR